MRVLSSDIRRRLCGLFFCLLATVALVFGMADQALAAAAPALNVTLGQPEVSGDRDLTVKLNLTPVLDYSGTPGTINAVLRFRKGGTVVSTDTIVVGFVYAPLTSTSDVVYALPGNFSTNVTVSEHSKSIDGTTVDIYINVDEVVVDDGDDGGGGGGGGGGDVVPISTPTTSGTDTGWQTYDPASDTSTVFVDPEKTDDLFTSPPATGVVLVEAPTVAGTEGSLDTVPENVTANIPLEVVSQAGGVAVPSILNMGAVEMELPPAVMRTLAQNVQNIAGGLGSLRVIVDGSTQQETNSTLGDLNDVDLSGMTTASQVITVSFVVADAQGRETKVTVDKASVKVAFNPNLVKSPSKVNLYIIGSLIYVGGKVDLTSNTVAADIQKTQGGRLVALEYDKSFVDIGGHWAQTDIELMASKYVVKGMTDTEFWPNTPVNRAQFVTLLVRSLGLSEVKPSTATFKDVAKDAWYYGFVEAAYKAGLATGDGGVGGIFRPTDSISREEMAVLLTRALNINGTPLPSVALADLEGVLARFSDSAAISNWARTELAQAVNAGLMKGRNDGTYDPRGRGTRAEAATMMSRLVKQAGLL